MNPIVIFGATALAMFATLVGAWITRNGTFSRGYDAGYDDARRGHRDQLAAMASECAELKERLTNTIAKARLDMDSVSRDADERVAAFAHRANPLTRSDASELQKISGQLTSAADLATKFNLENRAKWFTDAAALAKVLASKTTAALDAAERPAPCLPDTTRLDWIERYAHVSGGLETVELSVEVGSGYPGADTVREIIDHARDRQVQADLGEAA